MNPSDLPQSTNTHSDEAGPGDQLAAQLAQLRQDFNEATAHPFVPAPVRNALPGLLVLFEAIVARLDYIDGVLLDAGLKD